MSRYDGLIIPRSYSEYINKTDAATLLQALQLSGVMDNAPTEDSNHPINSNAVYEQCKKIIVGNYTPVFYQNRINYTRNNSKIYRLGNHIKIHIDITITDTAASGYTAIDLTALNIKNFPICIFFVNASYGGIGLIDSANIGGYIWLKDYKGEEIPCTALNGKRFFSEIDCYV